MRYFNLVFLASFFYITAQSQSIYDRWNTGRGGIVEIYDCDDQLCGKLVASENPERKNVNSPDPAKRDETLIGTNILRGFSQTGGNVWKKGRVYNPENGKTYNAKLTLKGQELKVRGYKGVTLFGKTVTWTREQY